MDSSNSSILYGCIMCIVCTLYSSIYDAWYVRIWISIWDLNNQKPFAFQFNIGSFCLLFHPSPHHLGVSNFQLKWTMWIQCSLFFVDAKKRFGCRITIHNLCFCVNLFWFYACCNIAATGHLHTGVLYIETIH